MADTAAHQYRDLGDPLLLGGLGLVVALATILAALGYEHIGGYQPCALCLQERIPFYVGIPVIVLGLVAIRARLPTFVPMLLFAAFALIMAYGAGLGVYHAGAEWGFWPGPATCGDTGSSVSSAADLLDALKAPTIGPSCTEAVWRFLGLSFAGWNAVISAFLVLLGAAGAVRLRTA